MWTTACTTKKTEAPELTGPSELGLSLFITATPDILTKDGSSQSTVVITARNGNSQPQSGLGLRVETMIGGTLADIGRLSTKSVTTGSDGRATVMYTAPKGEMSGNSEANEAVVAILVTPVGYDFNNAVARHVTIRLMPAGVILPPAGQPIPRFSFAPTTPVEGQDVTFDASATTIQCSSGVPDDSCSKSGLVYEWDFGDGTTGSGSQVTHRYSKAGSFNAALVVTNTRGVAARTSQFVNVGVSERPTAEFTFAPTNPAVGDSVFFNGAGSSAAAGRTIVDYDWTFGDGGKGSGMTVSHRFRAPGSWAVTLTVTDDLGKTGTASQNVVMGEDLVPNADFSFSPTTPLAGQTVNFDGRLSTATPGRSITKWEWNFGDGRFGEGERVSHQYPQVGKYQVVLTVTDSRGAKKSVVKDVEVK
jgi:PKD repeat protein